MRVCDSAGVGWCSSEFFGGVNGAEVAGAAPFSLALFVW